MAEIPSNKPTTDGHWADGSVTGGVTEPAVGRKDKGFENLTKPVHSEMNWLLREIWLHMQWASGDNDPATPLPGAILRRFQQLNEAIAGTFPNATFPAAPTETFVVESGYADKIATANQFGIVSKGGTNPVDIATDGRYILVAESAGVYLLNADDGSTVWGPIAPNSAAITCCDLDGDAAWVGTANDAAADEVFKLSLVNGSTLDSTAGGSGTNVVDIASNGQVVVWVNANNDILADVATGLTGTPDTASHGTTVRGCGLDESQCYLVGDDDTGDAGEVLRAYDITGGGGGGGGLTQNWDYTAGGADAALAVVSDGNQVYIAGTFNAVHLQALAQSTGGTLWSVNIGSVPGSLCVDHTRVYLAESTGIIPVIRQYNKLTGETGPGGIPFFGANSTLQAAGVATGDSTQNVVCDGMTVFVANSTATPASSATVFRRDVGRGRQVYRRADGTDDSRVPFYNQAVPLGSSRHY